MTQRKPRVAVSTGGGDCPGLNAVIRGITKAAHDVYGWDVFGIEDGLEGLLDLSYKSPDGNRWLTPHNVRGVLPLGGTLLGTSNKSNPFAYAVRNDAGEMEERDLSQRVVENFRTLGLDAMISIGGDGSMAIASKLGDLGIPVVGVPKTIDNDLPATDYTFGFDTAVNIAVEALDRLHTTAASHDRVMLLELMGRHAGFITLHAGMAGGADVILIPEIPYEIDAIVDKIQQRAAQGRPFTIIAVSEGAKRAGGEISTLGPRKAGQALRLGGAAHQLAEALDERIDKELRVTVLGHIQRGGSPSARDRNLGTRFGVEAMRLVAEGKFGRMVALRGLKILDVDMREAVGRTKHVDPKGEFVRQARAVGISFGTREQE